MGRLAVAAFKRVKFVTPRWLNRTCGTLMLAAAALLAVKSIEPAAR
jgi:hypothetical protein